MFSNAKSLSCELYFCELMFLLVRLNSLCRSCTSCRSRSFSLYCSSVPDLQIDKQLTTTTYIFIREVWTEQLMIAVEQLIVLRFINQTLRIADRTSLPANRAINNPKRKHMNILPRVSTTFPGPNLQQVIDVLLDASQAKVLLRRIYHSFSDGFPPVALLVRVLPRDLPQEYQVIENCETEPFRFCHET